MDACELLGVEDEDEFVWDTNCGSEQLDGIYIMRSHEYWRMKECVEKAKNKQKKEVE